ncbi:MAG: putative dithiol-disulfide isomerase involved in polyketide biosynthesis, partial [Actinomycetia bacterium]|nr:putative dithiol-disulfide isomerase involved in polyketide biosynthesis [Actinomycetes bacterium]
MAGTVSVTFDYRCPFARNAHEAIVTALREDSVRDIRFLAFSLDQNHVEEGDTPMWDRPVDERGSGILALEWGVAVRDNFPDQFLDYHVASFAARHDYSKALNDPAVLQEVAVMCGLDPEAVAAIVAGGGPLQTVAKEHTEAVDRWGTWGVPTFCPDDADAGVFIRFMERGR